MTERLHPDGEPVTHVPVCRSNTRFMDMKYWKFWRDTAEEQEARARKAETNAHERLRDVVNVSKIYQALIAVWQATAEKAVTEAMHQRALAEKWESAFHEEHALRLEIERRDAK